MYPAAEKPQFLAPIPILNLWFVLNQPSPRPPSAHLSDCSTSKKSGQIEQCCKSPAAWPWVPARNPSFHPLWPTQPLISPELSWDQLHLTPLVQGHIPPENFESLKGSAPSRYFFFFPLRKPAAQDTRDSLQGIYVQIKP